MSHPAEPDSQATLPFQPDPSGGARYRILRPHARGGLGDADGYNNLGLALLEKGEMDRAVAAHRKATELKKNRSAPRRCASCRSGARTPT